MARTTNRIYYSMTHQVTVLKGIPVCVRCGESDFSLTCSRAGGSENIGACNHTQDCVGEYLWYVIINWDYQLVF